MTKILSPGNPTLARGKPEGRPVYNNYKRKA